MNKRESLACVTLTLCFQSYKFALIFEGLVILHMKQSLAGLGHEIQYITRGSISDLAYISHFPVIELDMNMKEHFLYIRIPS